MNAQIFTQPLFVRRSGAPVFISNPHFYQSNPKFLEEVEGLSPQKELHETYFKIQPVSDPDSRLKNVN